MVPFFSETVVSANWHNEKNTWTQYAGFSASCSDGGLDKACVEPDAAWCRRAGIKDGRCAERAIGFGSGTPERSPDCGASPGAAPWMARAMRAMRKA